MKAAISSTESGSLDATESSKGQERNPPVAWDIETDVVSPAAWAEVLDLFEDANIYQTWAYGEVRWGRENLSHLVLRRNGEVAAIAQLRIYHPVRLGIGIAYLRWGPLFYRRGQTPDAEAASRMAQALREEYARKRNLYLRVLPNAFAGTKRAELFETVLSDFSTESRNLAGTYRTFILDLSPPLEELRRNLDRKWRNMLTQSEKKGLKIVAGTGMDGYRVFCQLYGQMWKRKGFDTSVSIKQFGRIQELLAESQRMQVLICEEAGVPVAGIVASAIGDSAIYLLGATSDQGLNSRGSYLLQWTLIHWLKERGFRCYDLGGIDPEGNPGVYQFKRGLSGTDCSHISPFASCHSDLRAAVVRAGEAAQRTLRAWMKRLHGSGAQLPSATQ